MQPLTATSYYVRSNEIEVVVLSKSIRKFVDTAGVDVSNNKSTTQNSDSVAAYILMSNEKSYRASTVHQRDPPKAWNKLKIIVQVSVGGCDRCEIDLVSTYPNDQPRFFYREYKVISPRGERTLRCTSH